AGALALVVAADLARAVAPSFHFRVERGPTAMIAQRDDLSANSRLCITNSTIANLKTAANLSGGIYILPAGIIGDVRSNDVIRATAAAPPTGHVANRQQQSSTTTRQRPVYWYGRLAVMRGSVEHRVTTGRIFKFGWRASAS